jgi:hypothetical protein
MLFHAPPCGTLLLISLWATLSHAQWELAKRVPQPVLDNRSTYYGGISLWFNSACPAGTQACANSGSPPTCCPKGASCQVYGSYCCPDSRSPWMLQSVQQDLWQLYRQRLQPDDPESPDVRRSQLGVVSKRRPRLFTFFLLRSKPDWGSTNPMRLERRSCCHNPVGFSSKSIRSQIP